MIRGNATGAAGGVGGGGVVAGLSKWLRLQRARLCGRKISADLLPTFEQARQRDRSRFPSSFTALVFLFIVAGVLFVRAMLQPGSPTGDYGLVQSLLPTTSPAPRIPARCSEDVPNSIECGNDLVPDVLCQPLLKSRMLARYAKTRTSPWHMQGQGHGHSHSLRLFQYNWSPPAFGTGNSWEATRVQLLASALLARSDVVCLQGLSGEQVHWLKDAFDMHGYDSIISTANTAPTDAQQSQKGAHARPSAPNAATFWRKTISLLSSHIVGVGDRPASSHNRGRGDVVQGALIVALNATIARRGYSVYCTLRVANTVVDDSAPLHLQVEL